MADTLEELYNKIDKNFPNNKEKCHLICTLLGTSANLTEYVMQNNEPRLIPLNVQYCILITSANMMSMLSDAPVLHKINFDDEFKISEQGQEHIYRKMKRAIDLIVADFKNREEEDDI